MGEEGEGKLAKRRFAMKLKRSAGVQPGGCARLGLELLNDSQGVRRERRNTGGGRAASLEAAEWRMPRWKLGLSESSRY